MSLLVLFVCMLFNPSRPKSLFLHMSFPNLLIERANICNVLNLFVLCTDHLWHLTYRQWKPPFLGQTKKWPVLDIWFNCLLVGVFEINILICQKIISKCLHHTKFRLFHKLIKMFKLFKSDIHVLFKIMSTPISSSRYEGPLLNWGGNPSSIYVHLNHYRGGNVWGKKEWAGKTGV